MKTSSALLDPTGDVVVGLGTLEQMQLTNCIVTDSGSATHHVWSVAQGKGKKPEAIHSNGAGN